MERKKINIKLADGKEYLFAERNREDVNIAFVQDELRKNNLTLIQDSVKNSDNQVAMMLAEMRRVYNTEELSRFMAGNVNMLRRICYDSFKINNENISFDDFKKLLPEERVKAVSMIISELESEPEKKKPEQETPSAKKQPKA